jgi:hypothetical protein
MNLFLREFDDAFCKVGATDERPKGYYALPQMMPWVGCDYGNGKHKKLLLIGESHYLSDKADDYFRTAHGWYTHDEEIDPDLDDRSLDWTDTRGNVGQGPRKWSRGYDNVNNVMADVAGQDRQENMFRDVAYYNYFLRPAPKATSFQKVCTELDEVIANDAFRSIVSIIQPDYIYFLSKFAWEKAHNFCIDFTECVTMDFSPHPASQHWNIKSYRLPNHDELLTGKEKFEWFLNDNGVFR